MKFLSARPFPQKTIKWHHRNLQIVMVEDPFADFYLSLTFPSRYQFHSPVFHGFLDKLYNFIKYKFWDSRLSNFVGPYRIPFGSQSTPKLHFFVRFALPEDVLILTRFRWWYFTGVWVTASFPQLSGTLLSILPNLNNAVAWMVSAHPNYPISNSSSSFIQLLGIVSSAPVTFVSLSPSGSIAFLVFRFLRFSLCGPPGQQSPLFWKFSFLF